MKLFRSFVVLAAFAAASVFACAQGSLQDAYKAIDQASHEVHTVQTDLATDQYQEVVREHDRQTGSMMLKRSGSEVKMILHSEGQQVQFTGGKLRLYREKTNQITEYAAGKNKDMFNSFLVLGFGGSSHDLQRSFDVKYVGTEKIGGVETYHLDLTPKSQNTRNMFSTISLWIDARRGVSVQQKFLSGRDYKLVVYSNIKINPSLSDGAFELKTKPNPSVVKGQ